MARWAVALLAAALIPGLVVPQISGTLREVFVVTPDGPAGATVAVLQPASGLRAPIDDLSFRTPALRRRHLEQLGASPRDESLSIHGTVGVQRFLNRDVRTILVWVKCDASWCIVAVDETPPSAGLPVPTPAED